MGVASLDHIEFYGRTVSTDIVAGLNDEKNKETLLFIDELNRAESPKFNELNPQKRIWF